MAPCRLRAKPIKAHACSMFSNSAGEPFRIQVTCIAIMGKNVQGTRSEKTLNCY